MLIMNLSIAAVIEGLYQAKKANLSIISIDKLTEFNDYWLEFDPDATKFISMRDLVFLLYELPPPLGKRSSKCHVAFDIDQFVGNKRNEDKFLINVDRQIVLRKVDALDLLKDLKISLYENGKVHYADVIKQLLKRTMKDKQMDIELDMNLKRRMTKKWNSKYQTIYKKKYTTNSDQVYSYTVRHEQAANIITKWAHEWLDNSAKRRLKNKLISRNRRSNRKKSTKNANSKDIKQTKSG